MHGIIASDGVPGSCAGTSRVLTWVLLDTGFECDPIYCLQVNARIHREALSPR